MNFSNRGNQETIDCTGSSYTQIPYWDIPCDATIIKFTGNKIRKLTRTDFRGLQQLQEVYLDRNEIEYMEAETFAGLPNLRSVNLGGNKIKELDERPFWSGQFSGSLTVEVGSNPFDCNIELRRTVDQIRHKVDLAGIICNTFDRKRPVIRRKKNYKGRPYDEIYNQIRKRMVSWEIGLIASACWVFFWACMAAGYFFYTYDDGSVRKKYTHRLTSARDRTMSKARSINNRYGGGGRLEFEEYEMDQNGEFYPPEEDPRFLYNEPYDTANSQRPLSPNRSMTPNMHVQNDSRSMSPNMREPHDPYFDPHFRDDREAPPIEIRTTPMNNHHRMSPDPRENFDDHHQYSLPNRGRVDPRPVHADSVREQEYFPNGRVTLQREPPVEEYSVDVGRPANRSFEVRAGFSGGRPSHNAAPNNGDDEFDI